MTPSARERQKFAPRKAAASLRPATLAASPLTPFQEQVCDLAGDMILHGGDRKDVKSLLKALAAHHERRRLGDTPSRQQDISSTVERSVAVWERRLARTWPEVAEGGEADTAPLATQTASALLRSTVRDDLKESFGDFLANGTPEELRLLRDILRSHESLRGRLDSVALAEAFSDQIGQSNGYIRVQAGHQGLVRRYVELLEAGSGG